MAFLTVCLNPAIQKTLRFPSIISGTVNRTASHRLDVSGKGINVTRVLTQLGKKAVHLTQLGGDMRPLFLSLCEQDGLSIEWAESPGNIRFCYTLLTEKDGAVTELVEESQPAAPETEKSLIKKFDTLLDDNNPLYHANPVAENFSQHAQLKQCAPHCLIISGTKAAGFSDKIFPYMAGKAKEKGMIVILDIRGNDLLNCLNYEPDIIKPNLFEFASTFTPELIKDNDIFFDDSVKRRIERAMMEITQKYKSKIILTNGSRKIIAADREKFFEIDVQPVKTVNSIGCGDAFTAGFASALENSMSIRETARCYSAHTAFAAHSTGFEEAINEGIRCGALNAGLEKPGVIR